MENRTHSIRRHATYTPEQWEQVRRNMEKEGYRSFQSFVRDRTTGTGQGRRLGPVTAKTVASLREEMATGMKRVANNINQVAHQVNLYMKMAASGSGEERLNARMPELVDRMNANGEKLLKEYAKAAERLAKIEQLLAGRDAGDGETD